MSAQPEGTEATRPSREWFEKTFVHGGKVTYCSECHAIPFAFVGHDCMSIDAMIGGWAAEKIAVPYRWEDVVPVESDTRPGDWKLMWVGEEAER